jgi:hypothetical protein
MSDGPRGRGMAGSCSPIERLGAHGSSSPDRLMGPGPRRN